MTSNIGIVELAIVCIMGLILLGLLAAVIVGAVWLVRRNRKGPAEPVVESNALMILKGRYARGEITAEQFEQMKRDLER